MKKAKKDKARHTTPKWRPMEKTQVHMLDARLHFHFLVLVYSIGRTWRVGAPVCLTVKLVRCFRGLERCVCVCVQLCVLVSVRELHGGECS